MTFYFRLVDAFSRHGRMLPRWFVVLTLPTFLCAAAIYVFTSKEANR